MIPIDFLPKFIILVFSVVVHEVAHGWAALKRGDNTAQQMGRLTLNPIPHVDLFGTILLPMLMLVLHFPFIIGRAKPVPVNPFNFRDPKRDMAFTAVAGPLSNLGLAVLSALLLRLTASMSGSENLIPGLMFYAVVLNLVLALFNLMPVPPLDGSRIVVLFLSDRMTNTYYQLERYGFLIVIGLFYLGVFQIIINPVLRLLLRILIG